jgi:general stress protein 26
MKVEPQSNEDLKKLGDLVEHENIAMLTTICSSGAVVARPMSVLAMDEVGLFLTLTDRKASKVAQLGAVNLCFSSEYRSTYVSISGQGFIFQDPALIQQYWTPLAQPWLPYGANSPNLALLAVRPDSAEYWDGPSKKTIRLLGIAASTAARRPLIRADQKFLTEFA